MSHHALALLAGGAVITVLHALGPDHWLPHITVSRAQGWSLGRTLRVTLLAAGSHVALTLALGVVILTLVTGFEVVSEALTTSLMALVLGVVGAFFVLRGLLQPRRHEHAPALSDGAATALLLLVAAFPPCYAILPLFLAVGPLGWSAGLPLIALFAGLTVATMAGLVTAGRSGLATLDRSGRLHRLEDRQDLVIGGVFLLLVPLLLLGF